MKIIVKNGVAIKNKPNYENKISKRNNRKNSE